MLDKTKTVQGLTVYAEFAMSGFRTELFITPDGFTDEGNAVPAKVYTRVVSKDKPKKLWSSKTLQFAPAIAQVGEKDLDLSEKEAFIDKRTENLEQVFSGILAGEWQLTKEPILVETSQKDLAEVAKGETPIKIVYRINQSRKALGFPAEIA
jgi:hypothetical protein